MSSRRKGSAKSAEASPSATQDGATIPAVLSATVLSPGAAANAPLLADPDDEVDAEAEGARLVVEIPGTNTNDRLDAVLASLVPDLSRSRLKALVKDGQVRLAGRPVTDPSRHVVAGDVYTIDLPEPEPADPQPEDIPLDVLYEDDQLIVIDKPAGLVVHPGAGNWTGTLVNALLHHCGDSLSGIGGVRRPGIVHRLDKDTSGVMVVAKTDTAHKGLAAQFADHGRTGDLERAYMALVWGSPEPFRGQIDAPIGRSATDRTRMSVRRDGKEAITHYEVVERYPEGSGRDALASLVECRLETGRTHQIRVHMAEIGHPLLGDPVYGRGFLTKANLLPEEAGAQVRAFPRQALHAFLIAFAHPVTGDILRFESPIPQDMRELIGGLDGC
ncbi:RluA family pseudouridine synthase [Methylobrevis pamukkalensis]|uniref:Pseudouridine synthase n=1 Tax=Methylobrevis pamukkalensis TaxID=1439726 RepID=A0A1E3GX42_9HYPH|nr:RluA family pseudouridine synthase [Methylobrevis pamukkalensis]ODN68574.1 Ribosomal large subunit pseudouridine synthase D [Methylobrevis pamukkalensis]